MKILQLVSLLMAAAFLSFACGGKETATTSDTPTEAYKRLYNAVKAKKTDEVKGLMSKKTQEFAEMAAQRQNATVEKVYSNGFTATTFSPQMPEIRDERVKGNYGAIEVWNSKDNIWEDLHFVLEDGTWKFAVGEDFAGTFKSPGKGRDEREKEAANVARGGAPPVSNTNAIPNINTNIPPDPSKNRAK
jgi:hypothetical protein